MLLKDLMAVRGVPNPDFKGAVTNDDNVLAINHTGKSDAHPDEYAVLQVGISGVDSNMNPTTQDNQYIRAGTSTTKTGTQRTFSVSGDRVIGDEAQEFAFSHQMMYGTGETVVVDYVWFSLLNGKGEKGKMSLIVNSDSSGNAGDNAGIDIGLSKIRDEPVEYFYEASNGIGGGGLQSITVLSVAGSTTGKSEVNATPAVPSGMIAVYKTGSYVSLPSYNEVLDNWDAFTSGAEYEVDDGDDFVVAYVDSADKKCKYAGKAATVAAAKASTKSK